jgi:hypothetical protein
MIGRLSYCLLALRMWPNLPGQPSRLRFDRKLGAGESQIFLMPGASHFV